MCAFLSIAPLLKHLSAWTYETCNRQTCLNFFFIKSVRSIKTGKKCFCRICSFVIGTKQKKIANSDECEEKNLPHGDKNIKFPFVGFACSPCNMIGIDSSNMESFPNKSNNDFVTLRWRQREWGRKGDGENRNIIQICHFIALYKTCSVSNASPWRVVATKGICN